MKTLRIIIPTIALLMNPYITTATEDEKTPEKKETSSTSTLSVQVIDLKHPTCSGESNGMIQVEAQGGVAPYTYNWNSFPNQYTETATDLTEGTYFVHVEDAAGNKYYQSVELIAESAERLSLRETDYSIEAAKKMIELTDLYSQSPSRILLDGKEVEEFDKSNLDVGIHKVQIISDNQCVHERFVQVYEYAQPTMEEVAEMSALSAEMANISMTDYSVGAANKMIEFQNQRTNASCVTKLNGQEVATIESDKLNVGIHKVEIFEDGKLVHKRFIQIYQMELVDNLRIVSGAENTNETIISK